MPKLFVLRRRKLFEEAVLKTTAAGSALCVALRCRRVVATVRLGAVQLLRFQMTIIIQHLHIWTSACGAWLPAKNYMISRSSSQQLSSSGTILCWLCTGFSVQFLHGEKSDCTQFVQKRHVLRLCSDFVRNRPKIVYGKVSKKFGAFLSLFEI